MTAIKVIVFDMAGTTVSDHQEVLQCFTQASEQTQLVAPAAVVNAMMGLPKKAVFETLWANQIGADHPDYAHRVDASYRCFQEILEDHYQSQPLEPTTGCLALFDWLRSHQIAIALTTGFYREVTDIILNRLGWNHGLDQTYVGTPDSPIQVSVSPSEIYGNEGRPAPFMIQKAMYRLGIDDPKAVISIGDTPADLAAGRHAGCRYNCAVTNGTHSHDQLAQYPQDGLFADLSAFQQQLEKWLAQA